MNLPYTSRYLLLFLLPLLFISASCRKSKEDDSPSLIKSTIFPIHKNNYWRYNFYARLTASTYSTDAVALEMRIGNDTKLPDGRDAAILIITSGNRIDSTWLVNDGTDLIFYRVYPGVYLQELLRLQEPLAAGQIWEIETAPLKIDSTEVTGQGTVVVPAGSFDCYTLTQRTEIPYNTPFWTEMLSNDYWIKPGVGIIKQDLLSWTFGYPVNPIYYHGRYELVEYKLNGE